MSHILLSSSKTYDKLLNSKIGAQKAKTAKSGKRAKEKEIAIGAKSSISDHMAAKGLGGTLHLQMGQVLSSSPSTATGNTTVSSTSSWRRTKEKRKEKKEQKRSKRNSRRLSREATPETEASETTTPPPSSRRLSLKLPRSPRGDKDSSSETTPKTPQSPSSSHHIVTKLFSSHKLFASRKESIGKNNGMDKSSTELRPVIPLSNSAESYGEAERKRKEAEDFEEKRREEKAKEEQRRLERERER